jgi:hypothetical protein
MNAFKKVSSSLHFGVVVAVSVVGVVDELEVEFVPALES